MRQKEGMKKSVSRYTLWRHKDYIVVLTTSYCFHQTHFLQSLPFFILINTFWTGCLTSCFVFWRFLMTKSMHVTDWRRWSCKVGGRGLPARNATVTKHVTHQINQECKFSKLRSREVRFLQRSSWRLKTCWISHRTGWNSYRRFERP